MLSVGRQTEQVCRHQSVRESGYLSEVSLCKRVLVSAIDNRDCGLGFSFYCPEHVEVSVEERAGVRVSDLSVLLPVANPEIAERCVNLAVRKVWNE